MLTMKQFVVLITALFLLTNVSNAQDTIPKNVQPKTPMQKRDRIHQEDHLMFIDGKLFRIESGAKTEVTGKVKLRDGSVVNPDGSYQLKTNERFQLHEGECLDLDGHLYQSQGMFNQRQRMSQQQMDSCRHRGMHRGYMRGY